MESKPPHLFHQIAETPTHKLLLKQWLKEEELILNRIALKETQIDSVCKRSPNSTASSSSSTPQLLSSSSVPFKGSTRQSLSQILDSRSLFGGFLSGFGCWGKDKTEEMSEDKETYQVAVAAIEIQTLNGYNFIERKIDRAKHSRTRTITDLFEKLVIGGTHRVTLHTTYD